MGLTGPFAELRRRIAGLEAAAHGVVTQRAVQEMGRVAFNLNQQSKAAGTTPAGTRWKPLASGGGQPLQRVGLQIAVGANSFKITVSPDWARFHQSGAASHGAKTIGPLRAGQHRWRLPKRSIIPRKRPPKWWQTVLAAIADLAVRKVLT